MQLLVIFKERKKTRDKRESRAVVLAQLSVARHILIK